MKPDDTNGNLPTAERPFRVLIIAGSNRRQYNCPGVDSKARTLMLRMAERLPQEWEIDYEDLGNVFARARIQSCNACVSPSMALCVWPCNCYSSSHEAMITLLGASPSRPLMACVPNVSRSGLKTKGKAA